MASFFRRKRSLIFKFLIGIPALYFTVVIVLAYQGGTNSSAKDNRADIEKRHIEEKNRNNVLMPNKNDLGSDIKHDHIHLGDSGKLAHDRELHAKEQRNLLRKIEEDMQKNAEKAKEASDLIFKREKEKLPERPPVDPNAPGNGNVN